MTVQDLGTPPDPSPEKPTAWAPLRDATFRMLWLVWVATNVAMWMNDVTAAWVMTTLTTSPTVIAMVQTASSLPVFLLGLPSGALADLIDRRRYLMFTQLWLAAVAAVLYLVTATGALTAHMLLLLVFINGIGFAMRWPVFSALVPELVSRVHLPAALALNGVAVNLSRVVGPLVAGAIIASMGSEWVFALNFVLSLGSGFVLFRWRREAKPPQVLPGERFLGAVRLGWQYVRESRRMKDALVITSSYFAHATALIALLPLVAKRFGEGGAATYTLLLSSLGMGAVLAATQLTRLRGRLNRDQIAARGSTIQAFMTLAVAFAPSVWIAVPAMFIAGMMWIAVANSVTIAAQLALPDWVRARGLAIYQMSIMGGAAAGAFVWGRLAEWTNVPTSLACAAASLLAAVVLTRKRVLEGAQEEDHTPTHPWEEPVPARPVQLDDGPVMVTLEYIIDPARAAEFESIMAETRSARMREGAMLWGLFEDVQQPGRFVEYFACDTWADYLRRFQRFTAMDERLRGMRLAFHLGEEPPKISRYIARHPPAR
ncbi:MAG TPA: MFS transporter [Usitatibacter sp.]|nr:MFS transporter [Usitatibacter sp.]